MGIFEQFVEIWNQADNQDLERIVEHVMEYLRFKEVAGMEKELQNWRKEQTLRMVQKTSWIFFPDSDVRHWRRLAYPWLTYCGRKIGRKCIVDLKHTSAADGPCCESCNNAEAVIEYEFKYAGESIDRMMLAFQNPVHTRQKIKFK